MSCAKACQRTVEGLTGSLPLSHPPPTRSFQLSVEMFDYMDCELKLSESGEPRRDRALPGASQTYRPFPNAPAPQGPHPCQDS